MPVHLWVIVASTLAFVATTFLTWFEVKGDFVLGRTFDTADGWDVGLWYTALPIALGVAMIVLTLLGQRGPAMFVVGAAAAGPVLLKLLSGQSAEGFPAIDVQRAFGLYLAALAACGLLVGGWLAFLSQPRPPTIPEGDDPAS